MALTVRCAGCGTPTDGAFCSQCGLPLGRSRTQDRRAWLVAWILAAGAIAAVAAGVVTEIVELGVRNESIHKLDENCAVAEIDLLHGALVGTLERLLPPA